MVIFIRYPLKTLEEPAVIAPLSAESPILATGIPCTLTVEEPALTVATCGAHGGNGGNGCDTVGSPTLAINIEFALQVDCPGVSKIVVPTQDVTEVKRGKRVQRKKNIFQDIF